jgi:hypothetical protein
VTGVAGTAFQPVGTAVPLIIPTSMRQGRANGRWVETDPLVAD